MNEMVFQSKSYGFIQ